LITNRNMGKQIREFHESILMAGEHKWCRLPEKTNRDLWPQSSPWILAKPLRIWLAIQIPFPTLFDLGVKEAVNPLKTIFLDLPWNLKMICQ
jgi:hypothetical protein